MVFGLFKKEKQADILFKGGSICTQDPNNPWAEAVAVIDGKIVAVGDNETISDYMGSDTEVVDLDGKYMYPGFIAAIGHPVLKSFGQVSLILSENWDMEEILDAITDYVEENPQMDGYLAWGYRSEIIGEQSREEIVKKLDSISPDKTIVLLERGGVLGYLNSFAFNMAKETLEDPNATSMLLNYAINASIPVDYEDLKKSIVETMEFYRDRGFTTVFDSGAPEYMERLFRDILIEVYGERGTLPQKYYCSSLVTHDTNPQYPVDRLLQNKTQCFEVEESVTFNTMKIIAETCNGKKTLSYGFVSELCIYSADRNFDLHIDIRDKEVLADVFGAIENVRGSGYKRVVVTFAIDWKNIGLSDEEIKEFELKVADLNIQLSPVSAGYMPQETVFAPKGGNVDEIIEKLTVDGAIHLGILNTVGSIEKGKNADFVIFERNLLDIGVSNFNKARASMTVRNGEIIYDEDEECDMEMYSLIAAAEF